MRVCIACAYQDCCSNSTVGACTGQGSSAGPWCCTGMSTSSDLKDSVMEGAGGCPYGALLELHKAGRWHDGTGLAMQGTRTDGSA